MHDRFFRLVRIIYSVGSIYAISLSFPQQPGAWGVRETDIEGKFNAEQTDNDRGQRVPDGRQPE
jgi:hypothetical protein